MQGTAFPGDQGSQRVRQEEPDYKGKLTSDYGIDVLIPDEEERQAIHTIIYDELCLGQVKD
ncbi:MAG: hypothetical protein ACXW2O_10825 [Candidatus Aminicenantales bacterium]